MGMKLRSAILIVIDPMPVFLSRVLLTRAFVFLWGPCLESVQIDVIVASEHTSAVTFPAPLVILCQRRPDTMPVLPAGIGDVLKKFERHTNMKLIPLLVSGTLELDPRIMCFIH